MSGSVTRSKLKKKNLGRVLRSVTLIKPLSQDGGLELTGKVETVDCQTIRVVTVVPEVK